MNIRTDLINAITLDTQGSSLKVVSELPFDASGIPVYEKNKKTVYVSAQEQELTQLYRTLDQGDVYQADIRITVYFTIDAKNTPSDLDDLVDQMLTRKDLVPNVQDSGSELITDIADDYITYEITYNYTIIQ